jgi:hypothetical protein
MVIEKNEGGCVIMWNWQLLRIMCKGNTGSSGNPQFLDWSTKEKSQDRNLFAVSQIGPLSKSH